MKKFTIPLQSEVVKYMKEKRGWPDQFCLHYADKFWNHYQASGWKLSSGNQIKDWKACFNAQWQQLKFKEDIDLLNRFTKNGATIKDVKGMTLIESSEPITNVEKLDAFIDRLRLPGGSDIPFKEFGYWYVWMKEQKLLGPFYKSQIDELIEIYEGDNEKCRCAVVQKTLMGYINNGLRVADLMRARASL